MARGSLPPVIDTWMFGVHVRLTNDRLFPLLDECFNCIEIHADLDSEKQTNSSLKNTSVPTALNLLGKKASVVELSIYLNTDYTTGYSNYSFDSCAELVSAWINRRHLQLSMMPVCRLDHGCQQLNDAIDFDCYRLPIMEKIEGDIVVDLDKKSDGPSKTMAILNGQHDTKANEVDLPRPAISCDMVSMNSIDRKNCDHLHQCIAKRSNQIRVMKISSGNQNGLLSVQASGKNQTVAEECLEFEKQEPPVLGTSRTSTEDNKVPQLPESDLMNCAESKYHKVLKSLHHYVHVYTEGISSFKYPSVHDILAGVIGVGKSSILEKKIAALLSDLMDRLPSFQEYSAVIRHGKRRQDLRHTSICGLLRCEDYPEDMKCMTMWDVPGIADLWYHRNPTYKQMMSEDLYSFLEPTPGKLKLPPMKTVWISGRNMTIEEKSWEHFLHYKNNFLIRGMSCKLKTSVDVKECVPIEICPLKNSTEDTGNAAKLWKFEQAILIETSGLKKSGNVEPSITVKHDEKVCPAAKELCLYQDHMHLKISDILPDKCALYSKIAYRLASVGDNFMTEKESDKSRYVSLRSKLSDDPTCVEEGPDLIIAVRRKLSELLHDLDTSFIFEAFNPAATFILARTTYLARPEGYKENTDLITKNRQHDYFKMLRRRFEGTMKVKDFVKYLTAETARKEIEIAKHLAKTNNRKAKSVDILFVGTKPEDPGVYNAVQKPVQPRNSSFEISGSGEDWDIPVKKKHRQSVTTCFISDVIGSGEDWDIPVKKKHRQSVTTCFISDVIGSGEDWDIPVKKKHRQSVTTCFISDFIGSGEDWDIPVKKKHRQSVTTCFISDFIGQICKSRSSSLLLIIGILLMCGSTSASSVSVDNRTNSSVLGYSTFTSTSLISGLETKLRKWTRYLELPQDCSEVTKNGGKVFLLEFLQMVFLVLVIIIVVRMIPFKYDEDKPNKEYFLCRSKTKTLFVAVSTSTLLLALVRIYIGSEEKKSFEISGSVFLQMGFCPAMLCALLTCLKMTGVNRCNDVSTSVEKTSISTDQMCMDLKLACELNESNVLFVVSIAWNDTLPGDQTFENVFEKCKAETQFADPYRTTCAATSDWYSRYLDPMLSGYTTSTGATRHSTRSGVGVFGSQITYCSFFVIVIGWMMIHICCNVSIASCRYAQKHSSVDDVKTKSNSHCRVIVSQDGAINYNENEVHDDNSATDKVEEHTGVNEVIDINEIIFTHVISNSEENNPDHVGDNDNDTEENGRNEEEKDDDKHNAVTSPDPFIAEYSESADSMSLAGTSRIDNGFVWFLYDFLTRLRRHQFRNRSEDLKAQAGIPECYEMVIIDYDEEAFDAVGISLKTSNSAKWYPNRDILSYQNCAKAKEVLLDDFENVDKTIITPNIHEVNIGMSAAVIPVTADLANEVRVYKMKSEVEVYEPPFKSSKLELEVFEPSFNDIENCKEFEYKFVTEKENNQMAVKDKVLSCSAELATSVTAFFNENQPQPSNATIVAEEEGSFIEANLKEVESRKELMNSKSNASPSGKPEDINDLADESGNMAEIRVMSVVSGLTDLPTPQINMSYLRTLVYRIEEPLLSVIDRLASSEPPTPHVSMRYELLRFCTLRTYPRGDKPYLLKLAAAGFYYASDGDGVVCYCCGSRRYNWTSSEDPMKVHEGIKPNCRFLKKNEDVNVPVVFNGPWTAALTAIEAIPEPSVIRQELETVNREYAPERRGNDQESTHEQQTLGINNAKPKHSDYVLKPKRLQSYKDWPTSSKLKPEELSDAGFFYAGFGDCVRCFFCGIGLRHWSDNDDPWIEHARWARTCVFVRQKKGEEFVNLVQLAVQLTQDNGPTGASVGNVLPASTLEKLLLSKAALSAAEMGFNTGIIKRAVEEMISIGVTGNLNPEDLLCKVLEIEGRDERAAASNPTPTNSSQAANKVSGEATTTSVVAPTKPSMKEAVAVANDAGKAGGKTKTDNTKKPDKNSDSDSLQDPVAIKHENEVLKEQTLCKVCLDNTVCIVFLPCGHLVTCADCAPAMRKCPICRALVRGTVRTYMS